MGILVRALRIGFRAAIPLPCDGEAMAQAFLTAAGPQGSSDCPKLDGASTVFEDVEKRK